MNNLTTRKIVLGLLMVLVLAFSVQGTADAVSVSVSTNIPDSRQGVSTIEVRSGQKFEITLTVGPQGRTRIRDGSNKYTSDAATPRRVDSSGKYYVTDISVGTRMTEFLPLESTANGVSLDGYIDSKRPTGGYSEEKLTNGNDPTGTSAGYVSNSSGSVFDQAGNAVYYYRPEDTSADPPVTARRGSQIKISADYWEKVVSVNGRSPSVQVYYYDEEQITITPTGVTLELENGLPITESTPLKEAISGEPKSVYELTRSVTLICEVAAVDGSILIENTTLSTDYPPNAVERQAGYDNDLVNFRVLVLPAPTVTGSTLTTSDRIVQIDVPFLGPLTGGVRDTSSTGANRR